MQHDVLQKTNILVLARPHPPPPYTHTHTHTGTVKYFLGGSDNKAAERQQQPFNIIVVQLKRSAHKCIGS